MEYNIIIAADLEGLALEVAAFLPQGWRLKGAIVEHMDGYAQQLIRFPKDSIKVQQQQPAANQRQRRTKWIE
ncbi:hypothetical protein [Pontibacter akesuensis]|uniref:DUF1737 domain-containing protein n=1 Tax=Pontibacter akesuensis TaxID=388950 RepID=A0A1I7KVU1_9BACT|nr:hypothetical protein [Pontibacter akesuensis]GHA80396.1 hypothetical protein GCM10007389_38270 [Pontibacter akesuensis]SFV01593.1 hypothetical protein SAMN04487941_0010 [Pontibacter akesuensis]